MVQMKLGVICYTAISNWYNVLHCDAVSFFPICFHQARYIHSERSIIICHINEYISSVLLPAG